MADDKDPNRAPKPRKAAERRRRSGPPAQIPGQRVTDPPPPSREGHGDDFGGGAGVREPRRPRPTQPAAALELAEPEPQFLDLTR